MNTKLEKRKAFIINTAYILAGAAIFYVVFRYLIYAAWPFTLAICISMFLRSTIRKLARKTKLPHNVAAAIVVTLFYIVMTALTVFLINRIIVGIGQWTTQLPGIYTRYVEPLVENAINWYKTEFAAFNEATNIDFNSIANDFLTKLYTFVSRIPGIAFNIAQSFAKAVPSVLVGTIIMIVSSYFISMDYNRLRYFIYSQLSRQDSIVLRDSREYLSETIGKIIVSYGIILLITMTECFIGLSILGVKNAFIIAVIIGICDILPILGTGTIVIPWAVICLLNGNMKNGIGLLVMYGIITVVRQITEPKIAGESIGLHPIVMLACIYMGAKIFGGPGIIILPFAVVIIKKLNDNGSIHIFNSRYFTNEDLETEGGVPYKEEE